MPTTPELAARIIRARGELVTLVHKVQGAYDEVTRTYPDASETTVNGVGAIVTPYASRDVDGSSVLASDARCVMEVPALAAEGVVPEAGDRVVVGTESHTIVHRNRQRYGGETLQYLLQLRGVA